jgi:hypothetical protein
VWIPARNTDQLKQSRYNAPPPGLGMAGPSWLPGTLASIETRSGGCGAALSQQNRQVNGPAGAQAVIAGVPSESMRGRRRLAAGCWFGRTAVAHRPSQMRVSRLEEA